MCVQIWCLSLFFSFCSTTTISRHTEQIQGQPKNKNIMNCPIPARGRFHTCLIWSVFISVPNRLWENSGENVLRHYGNEQSGCRNSTLHKAAAQPEYSVYIDIGKSFSKVVPYFLRGTQGDCEICSYSSRQSFFTRRLRGMIDAHRGIQVEKHWESISMLIHLCRRRWWQVLNLQGFL